MNKTERKEPPLCAAVPAQVRRTLAELVDPDAALCLAVATDIKLDGQYGEAWLMATDDLLVAFSPDSGGPPDTVCFPLAEINGVEVREDWGTATLKVRTEEQGATMAVFKNETGRIMASVTQDVGRLQDFISDGLQEAIRDVLTLVIICIILFMLNPGLAALVLLPTPLLVWGGRQHCLRPSRRLA